MAATETPVRSVPARGVRLLVDAALVAGIVALLLFPILAKLAADRLPTDAPPRLAPLPADARAGALRDLPVGLQPGGDLRTRPSPCSASSVRRGCWRWCGPARASGIRSRACTLPLSAARAAAAGDARSGAGHRSGRTADRARGGGAGGAAGRGGRLRAAGPRPARRRVRASLNVLLLVASERFFPDGRIDRRRGSAGAARLSRRPDAPLAGRTVAVDARAPRHARRPRPRRRTRDLPAARPRAPGFERGVGGPRRRPRARGGDDAARSALGRAPPVRAGSGGVPARRPPRSRRRARHGRRQGAGGTRPGRRGRRAAAACRRRAAVAAAPAGSARRLSGAGTALRRGGRRGRAARLRWRATHRRDRACSPKCRPRSVTAPSRTPTG